MSRRNMLGQLFTVLWMGWVYAIEDTLMYTWWKSRAEYDKIEKKIESELIIYKDRTYPVWRCALAKARIKVMKSRLPKPVLQRKNNQIQKKLTEFEKSEA